MGITSNRLEVVAGLRRFAGGFGLRRVGRYKKLGEDIADAIAQGELDRTVNDQRTPEGNLLAPLSPKYRARKLAEGYPDTILVREREMLTQKQLVGLLDIRDSEMAMTYGTDQDQRDKAEWAHEGAGNRPERPFVGLDAKIERDLDRLVDEGLDRQAVGMGAE